MKLWANALIVGLLAVSACANPTASIEKDVAEFTRKFPNQMETRRVGHHSFSFVWNGSSAHRPLVFVHGSPGSWDGWAKFLLDEALLSQFQVIAVDRPGYGESTPGETERSLAEQADRIVSVLAINKSRLPAIFVGHSYGGPVIAKIAMRHPKLVAGLVFVASSVAPQLEETKWYQTLGETGLGRLVLPQSLRVCNQEILALRLELEQMMPEWAHLQAKSVVIQGLEDTLVPPGNADFLEHHLPPASLIGVLRIKGLNHFVPWTRPDLILDGIRLVRESLAAGRRDRTKE